MNNIYLQDVENRIANNPEKYESVIIGKNIINDNNDFELIPKKVKKKVKKTELA